MIKGGVVDANLPYEDIDKAMMKKLEKEVKRAFLPDCDFCHRPQTQPGAILVSPPDEHRKYDKLHVCVDCVEAIRIDDPETDNTPFAHPAFWRGQDDGVWGVCMRIEKLLDGQRIDEVIGNNKYLEAVRQRILALMQSKEQIKHDDSKDKAEICGPGCKCKHTNKR